jgi:membrane protease YdiL (CAAX protease family)
MGGFVEEIIRAYLIYSIVEVVGSTRAGWICAVLGSSLFYALNHEYQGFSRNGWSNRQLHWVWLSLLD